MIGSTLFSTLRLSWHLRNSSFVKHTTVDEKEVDIYCSSNISVPLSIGLFPKRVYVPMLWSSLTKELQHSLLRHEVAHIKRKDGLLGALQMLARAIYFFHPLVWILTRQADELREMACDDMAVDNSEVTPLIYSRCLVHVAEHMLPSWSCSSASTLMKQKNKLYHRVNYQVKETKMKQLSKHRSRLIWTILLVLVVPLSWYCKQADAAVGLKNNETGRIYGKVTAVETGEPIAGANIILQNTPQGAASNEKGEYFISNIKPGKYSLKCSVMGRAETTINYLKVSKGKSLEQNFTMFAKALQYDKVTINSNQPKDMKSEQEAPPAPPLPPTDNVEFDKGPIPVDGFQAISKAIKYPESARKVGLECKVVASIYINENGNVIAHKIKETSPLTTDSESFIPDTKAITDCEQAAIDALSSLKWIPAMNDNQPVAVWVTIPVTFRLPNQQGATQMKIEGKKSDVEFTASTSWSNDRSQVKPKDTQASQEFVPYDTPPKLIGGDKAIQSNLAYPKKAKKEGIEGTVVVQAKISIDGHVDEIQILRGVSTELNKAATEAIKQVKFHPAKQGDKEVAVWITIPVEFKLDENDSTAKDEK